jgi:predicted oxidoreductase (fatty acid repression mutant protein)
MVLRVLLLAVVVVTPTAFAAEKQRMVVLNLTASDKSLQPLAESTSELVSTELSRSKRFEIISQSDVATMLGVERQRQLLGCAKDGTRPSETRRE